MILRECAVPPVIVNVFAIDEYATFAVVEYLQVAASFVANEIVADGVPVVNVPEGNPPLRTGEVVSVPLTVKLFVPEAGSRPALLLVSLAVA